MSQVLAILLLAPIWFWFALQPIQNHVSLVKEQYIENVVHVALEEAKIKGDFSQTDLTNIQDKVAQSLGYPASEVTVKGTTTPQPRGNNIYLQVNIPTRVQFLNLSGGNNKTTIGAKETAMSEALIR